MDNGIRILTEDEFKKMSVSIERRVQMSDVAYYFSNKNTKMSYEPYLLETGSVPKIVKNDGLIHEFKAIKMGQKFDVNLQGRVVAVPNYNFEILKKMGIRPVIPLSMIPESIANNTTNYFSYGFYPVNIPKQADQDLITVMFLSSSYSSLYSIKLDGKSYYAIEIYTPEHGIQKFINLKEHTHKFTEDEYMWAELKRIEWAIDRDLGLAIANFIPMTNIDFNNTFYYKSFKATNLYKWLNGEFLNTIMVNEDEKLIIPKKQKVNILDFKDTEAYKKIIDSVTFLSFEECYDENKKLDIFKYINPSALATDFALVTGAYKSFNVAISDDKYFSKTFSFENVRFIGYYNWFATHINSREECIRPVIPYSLIYKYLDKNKIRQKNGYVEFEFGFYPQKVVSLDVQNELYHELGNKGLKETNSSYTIDQTRIDDGKTKFAPQKLREFIYKGKKYVYLFVNISNKMNGTLLSNDNVLYNGDDVWIEVLPITWVASLNDNIAMPKNLLLAGIQFNNKETILFENSDVLKFVKNCFLPDIFHDIKVKSNLDVVEDISEDKNTNNNIFDIDLSNFSFADIDTQKNNRKKELGIDNESIEEFKKKIKNVTEEDAENLGKELFNRLFNGNYNDDNYDDVLKLIIDGANVNYRSAENKLWFPLFICAKQNYLKTFIILIQAGANINIVTDYGMSSAMVAASCGNKEILEILISMGADINIKDYYGYTALSFASFSNEMECARMLADAGANLNSTNLKGQTIFDYESGIDVASSLNSDNASVSKQEMSFDDLLSEAANIFQELNDDSNKKLVKGFGKN